MTMLHRLLFSATLLAVGMTLAPAQVTKSGAGYLLRSKYTTGQVLKYSSTTSIKGAVSDAGPESAYKLLMPLVIKVDSVVNGKAKATVTAGPAKLNNAQIRAAETTKIEMDMRNKSSSPSPSSSFLTALPDKVVKVGSTWKSTAPLQSMPGQPMGQLNATYKFQGLKTVDKKSVAVITYTLAGSASGSGTILVLTKDGTLYRNSATVKLAGPTGAIIATSVLSRTA